jgi:uncharacterized protein (DUF1684 family)
MGEGGDAGDVAPAAHAVDGGVTGVLSVIDWRRRIAELYRRARASAASETAWAAWREGRDALLRTHEASPLPPAARAGHVQAPFFAYDPGARVTAALTDADPEPLEIAGSHGTFAATRIATAGFELAGALCSLDVFWLQGYGGGLFVPFRDLLDTVKGADLGEEPGGLVLDFNFAYPPSCAYDPRWACPLAPPGSRLELSVEAGERLIDLGPGGFSAPSRARAS